jgi:LemA protein
MSHYSVRIAFGSPPGDFIMALFIVIALVVLVIGFSIFTYNTLIAMIEAVRNNQKQIDIQLDRRFKVFESLIEVVKKYMDYEKSTLKDVTALRAQAQTAKASGDTAGQMAAENKISSVVSGLNFVFEQYPDLKANQNAMQLQEEIVSTENKLAFSKQAFNDSIETYNAQKKMFFTSMVVSAFSSKLDFNYPYWALDSADDVKAKENYTVKL